jgi:hypothetical protein
MNLRNLDSGDIAKKFFELGGLIEKLPASTDQTNCCICVGELLDMVQRELDDLKAERDAYREVLNMAVRTFGDRFPDITAVLAKWPERSALE